MFCPQCGRQMPDDALHCTNCGRGLNQNGSQTPPPPQPGQPEIARAYATIPNHLALAIIAIILCFPFGIAGLVQSLKVDQFIKLGDFETARVFSDKARTYSMIGVIVGVILIVLFIVLVVVFGVHFLNLWGYHYWR